MWGARFHERWVSLYLPSGAWFEISQYRRSILRQIDDSKFPRDQHYSFAAALVILPECVHRVDMDGIDSAGILSLRGCTHAALACWKLHASHVSHIVFHWSRFAATFVHRLTWRNALFLILLSFTQLGIWTMWMKIWWRLASRYHLVAYFKHLLKA